MSLRVRLLSAQLSHDTEVLSNMDPYCYLQLGSQRYRSKTKKDAGKKPVWNETFQFTSSDNLLKITVMDQDTFSDDLVGEGNLNVAAFRNSSNERQQIIQLYYKGKSAGKVVLALSGQPTQNAWGNSSTNTNTWGQASQNSYNQGNTQPNMYQSYNQPSYNQPYQQPNFNQSYGNQPNQWQGGNQFGNNSGWGSQGNMAPSTTPWGDLNQNNGWGNFNPSAPNGSFSSPNIPPNNQNFNPFAAIGGIFNSNNQPPPPPQNNYNQYNGNPYQ